VGEDSVETVSFTLSLSTAKSDESPDEDAPKTELTVETKTTKDEEAKLQNTTVTAAEDKREDAKQQKSPRNSPNAVIKTSENDAVETKKKTPVKKTAKTATKSSKTEAANGEEKLDAASVKTEKAASAREEKVGVVQSEETNTSASVSKTAANTNMSATASSTETMEEDEVETVSFTLSLSSVTIDESPAKIMPKQEPKVETKTTKDQKTKTKTAVTEQQREERKQTVQENSRNSPDVVIKPTESDAAGETKKKIPVKKTTKTSTKSAKAEAVNGAEMDTTTVKVDTIAPAAEEKVVLSEQTNTSVSVSEVVANAANGETKAATKTVKKKTRKASGDTTTAASVDAVVEEKSARKEVITPSQTVANAESSKTPTTNATDEAINITNSEVKSTAKTTKKKVIRKTTAENESTLVTEEKELNRSTDEAAVKEKTKPKILTEKAELDKILPTDTNKPEARAANEVTKMATETAVVKKKTKKVTNDVKSSVAQEDVTVSSENVTIKETSPVKQTVDAAKPEELNETEAGKLAVETTKTVQEMTSTDTDKEAAIAELTTSQKVIVKKKKPKKAAELSETPVVSEMEQSNASNANVDVTKPAAADADLLDKVPQEDVTAFPNITVAEHDVDLSSKPSKETSGAINDVSELQSTVVSVVATTTEESEMSNVVTLIQLDDVYDDESTQKTSAPAVEISFSANDTPAEAKPDMVKPTTDMSGDTLTTEVDSKNEESDYSYRRKSMDDFIKRILAEAREEQQKRMAVTTNSGANTGNLVDLEPTVNDSDKVTPGLSQTNKDTSLLDRRLASTDRKRAQKDESGEWTLKSASEDVDLDQDLAEIGRYFSDRNSTGISKYELERNGERSGPRVRDIKHSDVETVVNGQDSRRPQQNGLQEDSFVPRAREETAELVRDSSRPVRAIIDHQSDVIELLKTTSRSVDDLDAEIRNIRATFLDRQARIETLRTAVDAEVRAYQADQQAANERIQQQQIPGGHFVRDEFMRANNIGSTSYRSSAIDDLLAPRRRSGSVSSTSGIVGGAAPSGMSSSDLDFKSSALNSWVLGTRTSVTDREPRRNDVDDDASSTASGYSTTRSRRGGSVIRERTYLSEDMMTPRMEASRSYLLPAYDNSSFSTYSFGDVGRSATTYAPLQTSSSTQSYYQTDYGPSSSSASSFYFGGTDTRGYYGSDSRNHGYPSFSGRATIDPSRFRRAQSVSDFISERSASSDRSYNSAVSPSVGQFQSRFLDKVRARKAYGDDQYRSRFLASDSGSSSSRYHPIRRNYSTTDD